MIAVIYPNWTVYEVYVYLELNKLYLAQIIMLGLDFNKA